MQNRGINFEYLLTTIGKLVAIGAMEGLPEKHTPVNKYIRDGVEPVEPEDMDMGFILKGVKKRRRELGMTQLDLMAKANICGATITKAEGGGRVSYETVARIAYALGVTFDEIVKEFYGEDEEVCDESTSEYQNDI
jgi:DNA-binding XRE family transcriptional regulator